METSNTTTLLSWDTQLYADCVEFCPFEQFSSLLVCGTYQLCESESARVGRLSVHSVNLQNLDLTPNQLVESSGILDIKWCRKKVNDCIFLAAANASGEIVLYQFDDCKLNQYEKCSIGSDCLALSCDWFGGDKITVSDSKGNVTCLSVDSEGFKILESWNGHGFEAWVSSFDRYSDQLIYSGGDDSCLCLWDLRSLPTPVFRNRKAHQMGVTSIETSPHHEHLLATGSYDEHLLLWDKRQMKAFLSDTELGGGVWKLKWEPENSRHLLAATMHNGFHIIDCNQTSQEDPQIVASYMNHSSLAYGCDWSRDLSSPNKRTIATCSFYDHSLHLWNWNS